MTQVTAATADHAYWKARQDSWDRQQEWYLPDREERFRVMLEMTEALTGPEPEVLDLACGTGSISGRLLARLPGARTTGADLDPALLAIARGHFADEPRARFVTVDLTDPDWPAKLLHRRYDAVLTATALHWMRTDALSRLYGQLAGVVREGGVFLNADHMPDPVTPRINEAAHAFDKARREREAAAGRQGWVEWWQEMAADPVLADVVAERYRIFGDPARGDHADGQFQSPAWHVEMLRGAGFAESRVVWSSPGDAVVLGLR
ncbi:class I SAM-dependent methyltransferase [Streptomyces sp. HNM0574]|uniref:class I SAM-dependent methyltransferase n=1 Tax=Streptomyces sp. HNM0574 TaxID=2714954 RepID=UPI00146CBE47|nr:class I SAM-dependent methyltransferase [Streptomyces sp. HNM0574]NLU67198.1 class I SAM-dependent methyltransferase [Streptomyces sp. HNM0574]